MSSRGPGVPRAQLGVHGGGRRVRGAAGAGRGLTVCCRSGMPTRTTTAPAPGPSIPAPGPGLLAAGSGALGGSTRRPGPPSPPARAPSVALCGRGPEGAGADAGDSGAEGSAGAAAARLNPPAKSFCVEANRLTGPED